MKTGGDKNLVLRKGAWTAEEDMLLKNYVQKYGEGKWHMVPLKAGLNRCRKSCRLRWLNYLRPNIKRGDFEEDEVDLMHRLHKLLGNRWSLIAGRIPGRTANDVKNYWNTHVQSRSKRQKELKENERSKNAVVQVIRPQPHILSKKLKTCLPIKSHDTSNLMTSSSSNDGFGINNTFNISPEFVSSSPVFDSKINEYLEEFFKDCGEEKNGGVRWPLQDGQNSLFNFPMDDVMWDFLDLEQL